MGAGPQVHATPPPNHVSKPVVLHSITGSARNEVRGRARATNELYLMDAVIEPERLVQISLGQENPRMRMNAAPGSRTVRTRTLKGFHNTVLCSPFRAKRIAAEKPGALPQADLLWPVGPNRSVSVGFQEFVGLCGLPHFPMTSASPSHPRFLTHALHFPQNLTPNATS